MFEETKTSQNGKQLDMKTNCFQIPYLCVFGKASGIDISLNILQAIKETVLPLDKLFNISIDGPNTNKTVWKEINILKKEGFSGVIPQTTCCLHLVHNTFRKGLNMYGEESEELAFNMH